MEFFWWLIIAIGLGIIEVLTVDLIFLMLAVAALIAGLMQLGGMGLTGQIIVFATSAAVLLLLVRPWAKRFLSRHTPNLETNSRALVGKTALVTQTVTGSDGRVRLEGEIWSARSATKQTLDMGLTVVVESIDGATAVVAPVKTADRSPSTQTEL